ncbi:MAG TPA: heparan-alpha-glucosaminide N-acetyltransferase domain-containing protein [Pyrinomonadaceae bacterium]|nr:heparan-alpha-glucosaminide N-acetyltransferase domain-containing protein [Pyrinomonadaceae bacterium]
METVSEVNRSSSKNRMLSLDVFRGLTIAGMILVNNPGTWGAIYGPLKHAEWHGWTPTDLIFPFFLFIVGISITLAFARRVESGNDQFDLLLKVFKRSAIIFGLGLFLNGFPYFDLAEIRIPGVLQRIAVCYLIASLIFLKTSWRTQAIVAVALLLVYWILMTVVPVPGFGAGDLSKEGNLAAYIDRWLLGSHIWKGGVVYDPEGLLSTMPAVSTTLAGILTGHWLRSNRTQLEKAVGLFFAGACAVALGWCWHSFFPVNKSLWTSSYVVFTAGMALQLLAICYWLVDVKGYRAWARPFVIFGVNALALFVFSGLLSRLMSDRHWQLTRANGKPGNLQTFIFDNLFASWASPINASLFYALVYILFWLFLMWLLYRKDIFIKV